jgi:hypothetical protein
MRESCYADIMTGRAKRSYGWYLVEY